jgi:hypothetical protein
MLVLCYIFSIECEAWGVESRMWKSGWRGKRRRGKAYLDFLNISLLEDLLYDIVRVLGAELILEKSVRCAV